MPVAKAQDGVEDVNDIYKNVVVQDDYHGPSREAHALSPFLTTYRLR